MRIWKLIVTFFKKLTRANALGTVAKTSGDALGTVAETSGEELGTVATVVVNVKRHENYPNAVMPKKGTDYAAGADLTCVALEHDEELDVWTFHTGLCMEIPKGYVGLLFPRSSIYKTGMSLCNCVGVIDSDYRGEVTAKMHFSNISDKMDPYGEGDRIVQMIVLPYPMVKYVEVAELGNTDRGSGGYGSTGK